MRLPDSLSLNLTAPSLLLNQQTTSMLEETVITRTLRELEISAELRDWEILDLAQGFTLREYKAGECMCRPNETTFGDSLAILASGEAEVTISDNNSVEYLSALKKGDLVGVITFIGGNASEITASVVAKSDCKVLLVSREFIDNLRVRQPVIVYFVMRAIVRQLYGVARHMNVHAMEIQNYIYHTNVRG